jgi:hypothetical protein
VKGYLNFDMIGRNNNEAKPTHVVYFYTEAHPAFGSMYRCESKYCNWKNVQGSKYSRSICEYGY